MELVRSPCSHLPNRPSLTRVNIGQIERFDSELTPGVARITCRPNTKLELCWSLRVLVRAVVSVGSVESPDDCAVNGPRQGCGSPVDGVCVELCLRRCDAKETTSIVVTSYALVTAISKSVLHLLCLIYPPFRSNCFALFQQYP